MAEAVGISGLTWTGFKVVAFNLFKNAIPGNQIVNSEQVLSQLQVMLSPFPDPLLFIRIVLLSQFHQQMLSDVFPQ